MSTAPYTKENPPVVIRNESSKTLSLTEFGKKSPNKGVPFFTPVFTADTFQEDVKWAGIDEVTATLNREYRGIFGDIFIDNRDEKTGDINWDALQADWADFTAGVQKLSDIEDEIETIQDKQNELINDPNFEMTEEGVAVTAEAVAIKKQMIENTVKIKALRAQREVISAKYAVRAEKRKANKAAKEAAAKAAAGSATVPAAV